MSMGRSPVRFPTVDSPVLKTALCRSKDAHSILSLRILISPADVSSLEELSHDWKILSSKHLGHSRIDSMPTEVAAMFRIRERLRR